MEIESDLIEDAAALHPVERLLDHRQRLRVAGALPVAEKEEKLMRRRKFRGGKKSAAEGIESRGELAIGFGQRILRYFAAAGSGRVLAQRCRDLLRRAGDLLVLLLPRLGHLRNEREKPGPSEAILFRDVRRCEERLLVRRHQNVERPSAAAGQHLRNRHVDAVDVRPLLPIDFDRDERRIHHLADQRIGERLLLHHVTPVAGRVADREEDRLVLLFRFPERFVAPWIPVHRVVRM